MSEFNFYSYDNFFIGQPNANVEFLKRFGIVDKASWKKWCLDNHPDKTANTGTTRSIDHTQISEINAAVNELVRSGMWK